MKERNNVLSGISVFLLLLTLASSAHAATLVFIEDDAPGGIKETANEIGKTQKMADLAGHKNSADTVIVAGQLGNKYIAPFVKASGLNADAKWLGDQGFYIKSTGQKIIVTANTHTGVLYGLMKLAELIEEKGTKALPSLNIKDRPVFLFREGDIGKKANICIHWAAEQQYPADVTYGLFDYKGFPEVFPDKKTRLKYLAGVAKRRAKLKANIEKANAYGGKVYLFMYQPALPYWARRTFVKAHPQLKPKRQKKLWHPFMCPSKKISKKILRTKIENLFRDFPGLGGILLNLGETSQCIYSCGCKDCESQPYRDRCIEYVRLIADAVRKGDGNGKVLLRPWGILGRGLEGKLDNFRYVTRHVPDNVYFWSKLTVPPGQDYLWEDTFSPLFNLPRMQFFAWDACHPQGILPCGAMLCYTAPWLKTRAVKLADVGVKGVAPCAMWPYKRSRDVLHVASKLASVEIAWNPYRSDPAEFLKKWAVKRFGPKAGIHVAEAMKDTHKLVDAFRLYENIPHWFHIVNFERGRVTSAFNGSVVGAQTKEIYEVNKATLKAVLQRFEILQALKIASNAEEQMNEAIRYRPEDEDLRKLWKMAKATNGLTRFYRDYHFAVIYNNMREKAKGKKRERYYRLALKHLGDARQEADKYIKWMYEIYPEFGTYFDKIENTWGLNRFYREISYWWAKIATIDNQLKKGHGRLVMEPLRRQKYPHALWDLQNRHPRVGYKRHLPFTPEMYWENIFPKLKKKWQGKQQVVDLDKKESLPALISPHILPKLTIKFRGDLSEGAMLVIKFLPLGGKANVQRQGGFGVRKSDIEIFFNGRKISRLVDIAANCNLTEREFIRFVELPPVSSQKDHELTLVAKDKCTGMEFDYITLYTGKHQNLYETKPGIIFPKIKKGRYSRGRTLGVKK